MFSMELSIQGAFDFVDYESEGGGVVQIHIQILTVLLIYY